VYKLVYARNKRKSEVTELPAKKATPGHNVDTLVVVLLTNSRRIVKITRTADRERSVVLERGSE
jgi:hypothetical protein